MKIDRITLAGLVITLALLFAGRIVVPPGPMPPSPPPTPAPVPPPPPSVVSPFPDEALRVLLVDDSLASPTLWSARQKNAIAAAPLKEWLDGVCGKEPDGKTASWKILVPGQDVSALPKYWQAAIERPRKPGPWLIAGSARAIVEQTFADEAELRTAIERAEKASK